MDIACCRWCCIKLHTLRIFFKFDSLCVVFGMMLGMVIVFWRGESEHLHVFRDDDAGAGALSNCVHCVGVGCGGPISPHSRIALHVQQPRPPWILHATPGSSGFRSPPSLLRRNAFDRAMVWG